jgi:hypothetical protein
VKKGNCSKLRQKYVTFNIEALRASLSPAGAQEYILVIIMPQITQIMPNPKPREL